MFSREMELEMDQRLMEYHERLERKLLAGEGTPPSPRIWLTRQNYLRYDEKHPYIDKTGRTTDFVGWVNVWHRRYKSGGTPR